LLILLAVYGLFAAIGPASFTTYGNLETILRQTTIVGLAALGMTLVIVSGGIDLSVGSVVALTTVVIASLLQAGCGPVPSALCGVAAGALCGAANGALITKLRVGPFIVTLGTLLMVRGAAKGLAHEQKIDAPLTWLNRMMDTLRPDQRWMLVPAGVWVLILLALAVGGTLIFMRFGRHLYAVGSNDQAARLCGVAVDRVRIVAYLASGLFAGLAGVMQFSRLSVGDPTVAIGLELDVIAAVVIGGASLSGGEGSIRGSLIGALIMAVIRSGCSQIELPNWVREIVTGGIIVLAVALDRFRQRRAE
jgi:ribose/xylose/arabinose/galactoside ABC-type transport system permease subunit